MIQLWPRSSCVCCGRDGGLVRGSHWHISSCASAAEGLKRPTFCGRAEDLCVEGSGGGVEPKMPGLQTFCFGCEFDSGAKVSILNALQYTRRLISVRMCRLLCVLRDSGTVYTTFSNLHFC